MNKLNKKGFTLIELIATVILLAIVMGFGSYSIMNIINDTKKNNYNNMIKEIKNAVEVYYQECTYVNNDCDSERTIKLGYLISNGYLKGNDENDMMTLVNPINNEPITECQIKYTYSDGKISIESYDNPEDGFCPETADYNK